MASVTIQAVKKNFGESAVLHGVDIDIADGSFTVLVGPSGCGKSTLLRMIAGLEEISGGEIRIGDKRGQRRAAEGARHRDGVPELRALSAHDGARQHGLLADAGEAGQGRRSSARSAAPPRSWRSTALLDRYPRQLSGGQRQRVAMGRAIVRDPQVFLFDEPLSNLDAKLRVAMRSEIKELHQRLKTTSIYVTHDQIEAMTMGDKIVVMTRRPDRADRQRRSSSTTIRPTMFVAGFIGSPAMNFLPGTLRRSGGAAPRRARPTARGSTRRRAPAAATASRSFSAPGPSTCSWPTSGGIPSRVVVVEPTGADTFVACRHDGDRPDRGVPRAPRLRARAARSTCSPTCSARTCSMPAPASGCAWPERFDFLDDVQPQET